MEFNPRAALCTAIILGGFAALLAAQLPVSSLGLGDMARDGLLPMTRGSDARPNQDRDIIGAVLVHEADRPGRSNVCLSLSEHGRTFEREKRALRGVRQRLRAEPEARAELAAHLERLSTPARTWFAPELEGPLAPESASALAAAEEGLLATPRSSGVEIALDGSVVPVPFRARGGGCSSLVFGAPAVADEIAFVETSFRCGAGCGEDLLYATVRRETGWVVAGAARL